MPTTSHPLDNGAWSGPFEHLLAAHAPVWEPQVAHVRRHLGAPASYAARDCPFAAGKEGRLLLVAAGWAGAACNLPDGRRQIVAFYLPGDVIDPATHLGAGLEVTALTALRTLEADAFVRTVAAAPTAAMQPLAGAWSSICREAQARLARHVIRLGRMTAYERAADFFLELLERQQRNGMADGRVMSLPLTQDILADHLGISVVHMNRVLQQLRRDQLIADRAGRLVVDPVRLAQSRPSACGG